MNTENPAMQTLDPQASAVLDALAGAWPPIDWRSVDVAHVRALFSGPSVFAPGDEVADIADRTIDGPGGALRLRVYRPLDAAPSLPITLFFHGGGFTTGSPEGHDNICRCLAARAGTLVVSVDYRLAPEVPFPAAVHDAMAALRWVRSHAADLHADAGRIAVAGDSAGGTLATVTAVQARDEGIALRHQLLYYPVTDASCNFPSYTRLAEGFLLTAEMMRWFWRQYLSNPEDGADPSASPLRREILSGVSPVTMIVPGFDLTCDEDRAYADRLRAQGIDVVVHEWPDQIHGFASMLGAISAADAALDQGAQALQRGFLVDAVPAEI